MKIIYILSFFIFCAFGKCLAQQIDLIILDKISGKPLPGAALTYISKEGKVLGSVANKEGMIHLQEALVNDSVSFSYVTYKTQQVHVKDLAGNYKIQLTKLETVLDEVIVKQTSFGKRIKLGIRKAGKPNSLFKNTMEVYSGVAYGPIDLLKTYELQTVFLNVKNDLSCPQLIEIRVMSTRDSFPYQDLLPFKLITSSDSAVNGMITIDLIPYHIRISANEVFLSAQLLGLQIPFEDCLTSIVLQPKHQKNAFIIDSASKRWKRTALAIRAGLNLQEIKFKN